MLFPIELLEKLTHSLSDVLMKLHSGCVIKMTMHWAFPCSAEATHYMPVLADTAGFGRQCRFWQIMLSPNNAVSTWEFIRYIGRLPLYANLLILVKLSASNCGQYATHQ